MIHSTRGIVLNQIKYAESSVIVRIYTELFGLQSYLINGVRSKRAKIKLNMLQPLSLLDMEVYHKISSGLQRVKTAQPIDPSSSVQQNVVKSSIAMFMAEVIFKSVKEEEANPKLFDFLFNSTEQLEAEQGSCANYHLMFMINFSKLLGFYPVNRTDTNHAYFDKREGVFVEDKPIHQDMIAPPISSLMNHLLDKPNRQREDLDINPAERSALLDHLINYYQLHLSGMNEVNSHRILKTVLQ